MSKAALQICLCLCLTFFVHGGGEAAAQIAAGATFTPPPVTRVLNGTAATFAELQKDITILDFFGTWCIPCLRALPKLNELKSRFGDKLSVVLVSNEEEPALQKFLSARPNFSFPIIVDGNNAWNTRFQPPALPYTVILNKEGQVVAITEAKDLTAERIQAWLAVPAAKAPGAAATQPPPPATQASPLLMSSNPAVRLSEQYLYAARTGGELTPWLDGLSGLRREDLKTALPTDREKKAFWINIYNAYTQATLSANPGRYKNRNEFFREKGVNVGGLLWSLDEIEHDLLRRSRIKWSLGYLGKPFVSEEIKSLRVRAIDYRIHFALNCGAESCPPIAFYTDEKIDGQLELATRAYLQGEVKWDSAANRVYLPKLMSWFRADFGGKKGSIRLLRKYGILPEGARPGIRYKDYDWTLTLDKYETPD